MCPGKAIVYILTEDCIEPGVAWLVASNGPDHGLTIAAGLAWPELKRISRFIHILTQYYD